MPLNLPTSGMTAGDIAALNNWALQKETAITNLQSSAAYVTQQVAPNPKAPAVPTGLAAKSLGASAALTWNPGVDADLKVYNLYRGTSTSWTGASKVASISAKNGTPGSFYDPALTASTTYYYWVTAVNNSDKESLPQGPVTATPSASPTVAVNHVSYQATPVFDSSLGSIQEITLTGNVTSSTAINLSAGQTLTFIVVQNATGGWTFAWPTNAKGAPTVNAAANGTTVQSFVSDGTNLYACAPVIYI